MIKTYSFTRALRWWRGKQQEKDRREIVKKKWRMLSHDRSPEKDLAYSVINDEKSDVDTTT